MLYIQASGGIEDDGRKLKVVIALCPTDSACEE